MESGNSWSREECESWSLPAHWLRRGITRRGFLQFCGAMAAVLGLPPSFTGRIAHALVSSQRPVLVWLHFQDCTGDSESLLRADDPSITDILLDILSVDYHETLMVPCGHQAEKSLQDAIRANQGKYLTTACTAWWQGGRRWRLPGKSAARRWQRLRSAPAPPSAVCRRLRPIPQGLWAFRRLFQVSKWSTCRAVP
jgi:NiFe hydrogenase small subunit HydA